MFSGPAHTVKKKTGEGLMMKKWLGGAMLLLMLLVLWPGRAWGVELPVQAEAALLMEKETGQVLYAKNEHQAMEPASVTKVMTLLLVMEAIDSGTLSWLQDGKVALLST